MRLPNTTQPKGVPRKDKSRLSTARIFPNLDARL